MDEQEMKDATVALMGWLESQGIGEEDAVPILTHTIRSIVLAAAGSPQAASEGLAIVANMIRD